jgi:O-antigen ligase
LLLVLVAQVGRVELDTGTAVAVNPSILLVPALLAAWFLSMVVGRRLYIARSPVNAPLVTFLLTGLLSLLVGTALWNPEVPRADNLIVVQVAQWAVFAFSAGAFWLTGNQVTEEIGLRRLTFFFLAVAGALAIMRVTPGLMGPVSNVATYALERAPFWMLLSAVAGGQLLFNRALSARWRIFLVACLAAVAVYALFWERATLSNWVGVLSVMGVLVWLRFPRLRLVAIVLLLVLGVTGFLGSTIFEFAGGEAEWNESGGSRLTLIGRVVDVTMRNPVTGLGPAAYRAYAGMQPLAYGRAYYLTPAVNSHNNYVDLFAHMGVLGLAIFLWFAVAVFGLGLRLRARYTEGFAAGYVNAMLAAWAGALAVMVLADWILPHVYNIGFPGFQASVLVWSFLGGLVALDKMPGPSHGLARTRSSREPDIS